MINYKIELCYDGTKYYGWEKQPNVDTIQGKLEDVLTRMTGSSVEVIGAGRTDAGVHARKMVANAHMDTDLEPKAIRDYMNRYLPEDICIMDVAIASDRFHARYNATGKLYTYTFYVGETKPVFNRRYMTVLEALPDVEAMKKAAAYLVGKHDFRSFCSNTRMKKSTVRVVDRIEIVRKKDCLYLNFHGTGFLRSMVRIMTGTLLEIGKGNIRPEAMKSILEGCDRQLAGPTAPPQGLALVEVDYS